MPNKKILIVSLEDLSRNSGFVNKIYTNVNILSEFSLDVTLVGINIDTKRIRYKGRVTLVDLPKALSSHAIVYFYLMSKKTYTLFHLSFNPLFFLQVLAAKTSGSKIVLYMDDPLYSLIRDMPNEVKRRVHFNFLVSFVTHISKYIEKVLLHIADYIFVVSPQMKQEYRKIVGDDTYIGIALNYIPTTIDYKMNPRFVKLRTQFKYVFTYFGQIQSDVRSYEKLLEYYSKIQKIDRALVFIGPDMTHGNFARLLNKYNLKDSVFHFTEMRKNVALAHLKKSNFLIIGPYPTYALPSKFFDAYYVGLPMLIPDNMSDAKNIFDGMVITYNSEEDLIKKIDNIEKYKVSGIKKKPETYPKTMKKFFFETLGFEKR